MLLCCATQYRTIESDQLSNGSKEMDIATQKQSLFRKYLKTTHILMRLTGTVSTALARTCPYFAGPERSSQDTYLRIEGKQSVIGN